jgi:MFS family permease
MKKETVDLIFLGAAHSLNHSLFLVLPPLLEWITTDLNTSFSTMGIITTITFMIYGTGALIGGPLSDRMGSLKVARLSTGLGGLMTVIFLVANDIYVFAVGMFLMALWASFYHPTANSLIAKVFTENTGTAMGTHNAAGNIGQVLTPTVAFLLGVTINWRFSFMFFGLFSIITAYLLDRIKVIEDFQEKISVSYWEFVNVPGLWIIFIYNVMIGYLFRSIEMFFPSFLSIERTYPGELAAIANSMILFFGTLGQILGGKGSDKLGSTRILIAMTFGVMISLGFLLILPTSRIGVILFIILYGISMFGHQPTVTKIVSKITPRSMIGLAYGFMFFSAFGIGSLSTTVTGYLADSFNITTAFWLNLGIAFTLLLVSIAIYKKLERKPVKTIF